jgi:hypothetical protein
VGLVLVPVTLLGYACSTDTFQTDGGTVVSQGDFCDAAAGYFNHCGYDAACAQKDLNNCGVIYGALDPAIATAYAQCASANQLECGLDFFTLLNKTCMQGKLAGFVNDSGALANLTTDYCNACEQGSTCPSKFVTAGNGGYAAALFNDTIINQIDTQCAKKLDGSVAVGDASVSCHDAFLLCEYVTLGLSFPPEACSKDGG